MLRRTNPAAILRALLALCLAWPAAPAGDWAGAGMGTGAPGASIARPAAAPGHHAPPRLLARIGRDGLAVTAAPGPEDRDVEDADGPAAPRPPAEALPPAPSAARPRASAFARAPGRAPSGRPAPPPRLVAIRC